MKLLFVISQFYKGGAETASLNLLKQLGKKNEHEIDVIIMNQCPIKNAVSLIDQIPAGIKVLDIWKMQKHISLFNRVRAKLLLTDEEKKCDPAIALLYVRKKEYDWAFHIGEWWSPAFVALRVRAKHKALWIHTDLTRAITFDPDTFFAYDEEITNYIFVSKASMNSCMDKFPFVKEKATCIYNISDVPMIKKLAKETVPEDYFDQGIPVLVTCANIRKEKNHKRQLRAMSILKEKGIDFIWLNIGSTSDKARCKELLDEAEELGLKDRFILTGARENPYKYMARASAVTVLSDYESWSMVITEAKILGVPVISTRTSGAIEQIVDGETGILADFNALSIADQIEKFLTSKTIDAYIRKNNQNFDNTETAVASLECLLATDHPTCGEIKKELLYVIDDINYPSGAHIATRLQICECLKRGHNISVFSSSLPSTHIRSELNGVKFLSWKDFSSDKIYHRRLVDCLTDPLLTKDEKKYKFKLTWEGKIRGNPQVFEKMVLPYLSQIFSQYDTVCVISEGSGFREVVASSQAKRKVQWIHTDYCDWRIINQWTKKITENDAELYKKFDKIVVLTPLIRNKFIKLYPHLTSKVIANRNYLPIEDIRKKSIEGKKDPRFLKFISVGRTDAWKAYDRLFEVLSQLFQEGYRFYWTIVGGGEDFKQIKSLFLNSKLRGYVNMTGPLSNPFPYVKESDVFALLSKYEGLPNTIFEALVLGVPVIATNVGSISTQIQHGETGWLVENNESSIYLGLKYLLDHPEKIRYMKQQLSNYQYDNISILNAAEEILFGAAKIETDATI